MKKNISNEAPYIDERHKALKYNVWTTRQTVSATDIHGMEDMSAGDYKDYIMNYMIELDPHNILRSSAAGYPIACNKKQLDIFVQYLTSIKNRLKD